MIQAYGVQVPEPLPPDVTFVYGPHPRHEVDFWRAKGVTGPVPLVFFVHGGAWRAGDKALDTGYWKASHFPKKGLALASTNYRFVPEATVEEQAKDAASALAAALERAGELGICDGRVILLGHSAGAHLVCLLGTDESYLRGAGLSFANIAGVIGNDGASYDAAMQIAHVQPPWGSAFTDAFGEEPERQRRLSPLFQADGSNAPAFLLLHMPHRPDTGIVQANNLADAVRATGSSAQVTCVDASMENGHHELNQLLGKPDHGTTVAIDAWLDELFG